MQKIFIEDWRLAFVPNKQAVKDNTDFKTPKDVEDSNLQVIQATVPGNYEIDFMREGLLGDVYFGTNSLDTYKYENLHFYYFTEFDYQADENSDVFLCFEGVDTQAEIYLDGEKLGFVENMLHAHRFAINDLQSGKHTLLVHILPSTIYARQFDIPVMCYGMKYNHDGIMLRKPGYMFGWDIMPRLVSAGLWKPVVLEYLPKARICNPYTYTENVVDNFAILVTTLKVETEEDYMTDYSLLIEGKCGDSTFTQKYNMFGAHARVHVWLKNPKLWWPKNYGEPNLYDVTITLFYKGIECDKVSYRLGIRTLWLKRTSMAGDDGDFCFIVNGKRFFGMGTNWVPCDALPSRNDNYALRDIELADACGCNMVRCWGGSFYPSDILYDYCDEHGILIWQDFALACGHYTDDARICALVKEEVKQVVLEKRQHPALAVWAGDNECDCFVSSNWEEARSENDMPSFLNPNFNKLTRDVILREVRNHDATRPYLPSSPYLDEICWKWGSPSESHIWGPRDFFKGKYYGTRQCHFASEIGYHGCPSPKSLEKFISAESMPKNSIYDICDNGEWLVHAAGMETCVEGNPYAYRLPLMISQVERIFGQASNDLGDFARQSQISQAEAVKYFIETFRISKPRKTGLLWWNITDGWPQISDAVVDWYGCKKLAFHYIKRSQQQFCMMCDEPKDGKLTLVASSEYQKPLHAEYTVVDLATDSEVASGSLDIEANGILRVAQLPENKGGFYLIRWKTEEGEGINHYVCNIGEGWTYAAYKACMMKAGFYDEFEGF